MARRNFFDKPRKFYQRYEKYSQVLFFFGGFLWDNLTLSRIDRVSDNIILFLYLILMGLLLILFNLSEAGRLRRAFLKKNAHWFPPAIQFLQGGLFSSYVVFYFQSASFSKTIVFVALLVLFLVANEFLEKRLSNLSLQFSLFFLVNFSFFIFSLPVFLKRMSPWIFFLGGIISFAIIVILLWAFQGKLCLISRKRAVRIGFLVAGLFLILNLFYWRNLIPPVPLSLKEGGVYHSVKKSGPVYELKYQKPRWFQYWKKSDNPFAYAEGDTVYCFSAVFAPTRLRTRIFHHWQFYSEKLDKWQTTDRLGFSLTGGRNGGYRGYTYKTRVYPGKWRVDVETEAGAVIGRVGFNIEKSREKKIPFRLREK